MGLRFTCARMASAISTWGLKTVFRRTAGNVDMSVMDRVKTSWENGSSAHFS